MKRLARGEPLTPDEFRAALAQLGWTQAHFSDRVGLTATAVNRWAQGTVPIPLWAGEYLGAMLDLAELHKRYIRPE